MVVFFISIVVIVSWINAYIYQYMYTLNIYGLLFINYISLELFFKK